MQPLTIAAEAATQTVLADCLVSLLPVYLQDCRTTGVRRSTFTIYQLQLAPFELWWKEVGPRCEYLLTPAVAQQYPTWLRTRTDRPISPATVETYTRRARQFFKWLYKTGRLALDISQWMPKLAKPRARTSTLNPEQIAKLFGACAGGWRLRNMALLAFLTETGCRRVEAANVTWDHVAQVDQWRGVAHFTVTKGYLFDNKERDVVFGEVTGRLLHAWRVVQPLGEGRVFGISNGGIAQVAAKLATKTQIDWSPHDLRRTFATYWIRHCRAPNPSMAERLLELQLGHSPRTVTQKHYLALTWEDVLEHYVSPLDACDLPWLRRGK